VASAQAEIASKPKATPKVSFTPDELAMYAASNHDVWATRVRALNTCEHAFSVAEAQVDTTWEDVGQGLIQPPAPADPKNVFRHWCADNGVKTQYYLMVVNNKISVVYGFAVSGHGPSPYERVYFLVNDHTPRSSGSVRPPKLMHLPGQPGEQYKLALPIEGFLCSDAAFEAFVRTSPMASTFVQQDAPGDEDEGMYVSTKKVSPILRIHPKMACVLMRDFDVKKFLQWVEALAWVNPAFNVLVTWFQHALTAKPGDLTESLFNIKAKVVNVADDDALEDWYEGAVERHAPNSTASDIPTGSAPAVAAVPHQHAPGQAPDSTEGPHYTALLASLERGLRGRTVDADDPKAKAYKAFEREVLFKTVGLTGPNFDVYSDEELPPFFLTFLDHRGKAREARTYLEHFLDSMWPADRPQQHFLFSTNLVADFQTLQFSGRDPQIEWARRFDGISIFSIVPMATSQADLRMQMEQFEDDTLVHTQRDRASNSALATKTGLVSLPVTRDAFRQHLEYFSTFLLIFFSETCPVLRPLDNIILELFTATSTNYWRADTWKALLWNLHIGLRYFFRTGHPGRVENTMRQLQALSIGIDTKSTFLSSPKIPPASSTQPRMATTMTPTPPPRGTGKPSAAKS
jgi:hypothetical protein